MRTCPRTALVSLALAALCLLPRLAAGQQVSRALSGWYNDGWDGESHASYLANAYLFSEINPFWYDLGMQQDTTLTDGTISVRDYAYTPQQVTDAHDNGDLVIPSIADHVNGQIDTIVQNDSARGALINNLVSTAQLQRYDGFDIDFERGTPAAREAFTQFVEELATALHQTGKRLTVTLRAATSQTEENVNIFDYAALAASSADRLRIMAYDHNFDAGADVPGPVGPLPWIRSVLNYAITTRGVPSNKIQLGLHNYGWTWKRVGSRWTLQTPHDTFLGVAQKAGNGGFQWDATAAEAFKQYTYGGKTYLSYVGTAQTVAARLALVDEFDLAGLAFWVLGREDPAIYPAICSYFADSCTPAPVLLSFGKAASASSQYSATYSAPKAVDGRIDLGWLASPTPATAWLQVDLGAARALTGVRIYWGNYDWSVNYDLQTSSDGSTWTTVYHEAANTDGGLDVITLQQAFGRYVRVRCNGPKSDNWSFEIYELQMFGTP